MSSAGIVKALQRLWGKIEQLEQIRISEMKSRSKEVGTSSRDEDLTITNVQYKLLVLQLQYVRSILRKKFDLHNVDSHSKINEGYLSSHIYDRNDMKNFQLNEDFQSKAISRETQTGTSLIEELNPLTSSISKSSTKIDAQVSTDNQAFRSESQSDHSASVISKTLQTNTNYSKLSSKPHYHLKLDDVPFILGASSTASHSVVANVQNIIAMMKSHNKALCGSKQPISRSAVNTYSARDSKGASKLLHELSQGLHELSLKQEKLVKRFDAAQGKTLASNLTETIQMEDKMNVNKTSDVKNFASVDGAKRCNFNSESSIKLHAEVKNSSKVKEKDIVKYNAQQKQNLTNVRNQPNNLPIMARRNLLRSLQNFKTHLSENDISWD